MTVYTYPGNIHIHSTYSDGSGSVAEIAAAAASSGISYVLITDHETLDALPEEGFHNGIAVLVGVELNGKCCHYLALGLSRIPPFNEAEPQQVIDAVRCKGGLGFIAHPFERGTPYIDSGVSFPWTSWPVFGFTGIEIWNYSSHWRSRATSAPRLIYWFLLNRKAAMDGPPVECLQLWDCYTGAGQTVVAVGGTDAHAARRRVAFIQVEIFPYRYLFRTINTYVCLHEPLSREFARAKVQIYSALAAGHCYVAFDQLYSGQGFSFTVSKERSESPVAFMGETLAFDGGLSFRIKSPSPRSLIRLMKDGRLIHRQKGSDLSFQADSPGVYRAEVYYCPVIGRSRPWLYSNPIYLQSMK
jgi:hypothetical protein